MTPLPNFITFTGADDKTDVGGMIELAAHYPVEFGILFSPARQGFEPRYPNFTTIYRICERMPADLLSAHLCGAHSRRLLSCAATDVDHLVHDYFGRAQVNTAQTGIDTRAMREWGQKLTAEVILQCRHTFPNDPNVSWLYDASGGRGVLPKAWPISPGIDEATGHAVMSGYAGGLNPDNVATAVQQIAAFEENYWIDMETGVRDENDRFSLDKCRAVCEAVYGPPGAQA